MGWNIGGTMMILSSIKETMILLTTRLHHSLNVNRWNFGMMPLNRFNLRTIQFNSFGWDSVADGHTCHVLLTGLVADAGKLRRLSCSQDDTFCLSLQPLLERGSKSTFLSSGLWMLPKQCDTICWYIACSRILFCTFYLLLQPLLELGSKSTSLSSGFSDVIKAARYDLLIHCLISWSGLFLEMWGGWMLSSDVAGVLQEAGAAYSRARTWSQV